MLWDLIRDFFVEHVFGGVTSSGSYFGGIIGTLINSDDNWTGSINELSFKVGTVFTDQPYDTYITMSDWLSTTATIISISIIVVLCCLFVYKIIKLIGGLIR